jgi:hypothetical protein
MKTTFLMVLFFQLICSGMVSAEITSVYQFEADINALRRQENQSYLRTLDPDPLRRETINDRIFEPRFTEETRQRVEDLKRDYEQKRPYGLSPQAELEHSQRVSLFTERLLRQIFERELERELTKAEERSEEVRTFRNVQRRVEQVTNPDLEIGTAARGSFLPEFKLGAMGDLDELKARIWLKSDFFDADFDLMAGTPIGLRDRFDRFSGDSNGQERYRVRLYRDIPLIDIHSVLTYWGSSSILKASLRKDLWSDVQVEVATRQRLEAASNREESVQLQYRIRF